MLVLDPAAGHRRDLAEALSGLSARDVALVDVVSDTRALIARSDFDLLIADPTEKPDEVCALIRDLRHGRLGGNPFVVVIATSWDESEALNRTLIDSGVDDIVRRPT